MQNINRYIFKNVCCSNNNGFSCNKNTISDVLINCSLEIIKIDSVDYKTHAPSTIKIGISILI